MTKFYCVTLLWQHSALSIYLMQICGKDMNYLKTRALLYKNMDINIQYCTVSPHRYHYEHI